MDEEVIKDLYARAQGLGYGKSIDEFVTLLHTDDEVLQDSYGYVQEQGYPKSIDDFSLLVGRKKKDDTESVLDDGSLASPEIAVAESVRTTPVPEPVEVLDETPARTLEPVAEEAAPVDIPVGQSVAVDVPAAPEPVLDFVTGDEEFDKSLGFVNADLVDRGDERQVARELTAEFKDFGFDFESTGIGDAIKVTARNGETMEVDLDPAWYNFGVDEGEEAKSLRKFLTDNKDTSELVDAEVAFKEAEAMYEEYKAQEKELIAEFEANAAKMKALPKDDVEGYNKLIEQQDMLLARGQKLVRESADSEVLYRESYANLERLSKPKERQTALERTFGRNSFVNWVSDLSTRAIDQGLAQGATIRENLNLAINANDVTDEELDDFRRAVLAAAEAGPSDEMQEFGRRVEEKTKGMSYGGKLLTTLFEVAKNPSILPELTVSSVAMMANKEVVFGGLPPGAVGLFAGPGGALTGFAAGTATTLEAGLSFGEFMMEELAAKQGVDINEVDMSNESLREVLSDGEAMSRMRNRAVGRGVTMGLFNAVTKNVASGITRRVVGKTGSKMKGILAAGVVDMPLESAGEAIGRIAGRQEMDPMEIVLEGAAKGPGFVIGVAEGLVRSPKYTLNGERVGGKTMAKFINEASEADVAGATIEIKNDKVLAGIANDKRNAARERQIIGKQLRESGITDEDKVQALTDLEMEKRKLAGNETTSGKRKRERIQRQIDATLEGDSYFFEETTDEQGNTISNEVRVTRAEAIQALRDDDITRPTEREIEQKQAELFRDAMAAIGKEDAVQEREAAPVDVGEQARDGAEVGVGDAEEEVVAEAEEAEAQELAERLEAEGTPDVTEQLGDNITAERRQGTTLGAKQEKIVAQAKKRAASLANSIPGLQVKLYETTDQYQRATGLGGKGGYTYENDVDADGNVVGKKNRVIHINLETANTRTVAHEAFHAMFLENLSDEEYQKQAKALMSTVRKALADDSDMARRIDEFVAAYDEAEIDEEALSEIFGYISNGYGQLSAPEQNRIKVAIKALIERITGIKLESGWSEGDQNVLDVLNTLAQKLEAGEEVTAEEVGALRVGEERVAEVEAAVDIDSRIAAAQEKVRGIGEAALEALGELANLATEVDEEAGLNLVKSVRKAISEKKASATIKKMRDVKKSKRMSADDKAERLTKLEAQLEGELERLNAEREKAAPKIAEAVERLKPKVEAKRAQAAKEKRLAEIKEEGKAITKERDKAVKSAKKEFEGEELKTALEVIEEETKAKRDKLKAEKAELEKKPVKEVAPVEEEIVEEAAPAEEVVEEDERIAKERAAIQRLEKKLADAKRDLKAKEDRGAKESEKAPVKKVIADIEFDIQDRTENIKELEDEIAKREEAPVVEDKPTVGTIRTKVGVEAFGKLEAAVRKYLEYWGSMVEDMPPEGIPLTRSERGRKATLTRLTKKVNTLSDELGLTGAELVTVQRSVQEKIEAEKRAAEAKETEAAERKAAAERAKKAAEEKEAVEKETVDEKPSLKTIASSKDNKEVLAAIASLGNEYSAKKVFAALAKNSNLTAFQRKLAEIIARRIPQAITIQVGGTGVNAAAQYEASYDAEGESLKSGKISLNPEGNQQLFEAILHEGIHALVETERMLIVGEISGELNRIGRLVRAYMKENANELKEKYPNVYAGYGQFFVIGVDRVKYATLPEEIITHALTNPEVQEIMKGIPDPDGGTVWNSFVESIRKLLGLTIKERTALDSVLEVLDRSTTYDVGEKVAVAEAVDNRNEMFQQDVADIEAMEVGDSIETGGEVITKVGEDSFEMEVTPTSKKTGNTEVATFYLNSKRAEARAGDKVRLRDYKVTEVRAQNLQRGDVITNIEDGIRYAYRVKGVFTNKAQGVVFVEVEVLDIGNQPVGEARRMEPGLKFTSFTTDYVVGQNTTLYFKKSKRDGKMAYRPIVQRLENWDAVNREEKAPTVEPTVDDVAKRAAVAGISVEELTKQEAAKEMQRRDMLSREAKRELDGLKGKTDKASKAKRAELKEFMANLGTMSVNEALSKRRKTPTAREQRVAANEFDLKSLKKIGEGSDRIVYDLGDGRVLKVAKTVKGLVQNSALQGGDKQMLGDLVPEVYFEDEGLDYVIMENVPRNDKAVREWMKFMKRSFDNNGVTRFGGLAPETMQYLEAKGLEDFLNYNVLWGDFFRPSSWGQRANGDFVLIDEGTLLSDSDRRSTPNEFFQQDWAEVKRLRRQPKAREQRVSPDTEGPTIVYRSGAVDSKAEPRGMMSGGRSTGHFGTGAYFFGDRKQAEEYDDREVTAVDIRDYNLAPASRELHDALRDVNTTFRENFSGGFTQYPKDEFSESDFFRVIMALGRYDEFYAEEQLDIDASDEVLQEQIRRNSEIESRRMKLRADAKRMYNEPGNVDSRSTVVMKVLGYDGVYATPGSDMDNATYGTVIYDVKPKAREQRASEVLGRYKFRPDGSLIGDARLASELRGYMRKFGFGVEQFGTREDRYHIVDERGRKVKPEDVIASDEAFVAEREEIKAKQREEEAKERMAREEAEDLRSAELKRYQDEYLDFPEDMIPPSTKNFRQQKGQLGAATEGLSTAAVVQFAKERGFSDKAILAIRPGAQQAIDKYDERAARVNREVQGIIQRTRERARGDKDIQAIENKARRTRAVNDRIEEDVLAYLKGTKFYKDASDVGREAMVRAVRKQMGRRMKSAPSVIKLGIDNGIPTIDKRDLNRQIKMIAESSRQTALAMREAMRAIGKDIELMQAKGLITGKQATLILKKLAATDPLNPVQVEKFTDYAARVFANAEYEQEVKRLNARRKRAFKQFETKLGVHKDYAPMLRTLLLIDATMIPQDVLEEYGMLIDMLGERKAVLDLDQSVIVGDLTTKVMTAIDEELSLKEELLARYENYPDKKKGYSSTIDAMVKDGELSQEEADVLRKYVSELVEEEEKSEGQRQQEAEEKARRDDREMARLRQALLVLRRPEVDFGMREERELVKKFYRMVKTEAVEGLTLPELKNALRVADNIENGFLPHMAQVLVEKMDAHQKARQVERAIKEARIPKRKLAYSKVTGVFGGPNATLELIKRNPLRYIDQVLGDFKSTRVYDAVFKPLAKAYAQYNSEMISIQERLNKVEARLVSKYKRNPNAITRSKFLIGAYMMQREFENNVGVDGVFSAEDLLQATIDADGVGEAYYTGKTTEMLEGILEEIKGKTADEIEASLNAEERAVAEEIRAINDELTPKAQYVAGVIRGVPFRPFSQYFHRVSLKDDERAGLRGMSGLIEQVNKNMRPSTRAKNLEVRTGSIGPVNFDPFASANRGAKFVLTDYYMTEPVRTAGRMANDLKGVKNLTPAQKSLRDALTGKRGAINTAIADVLVQSYTINTQFDKLLEFIKKQAYRMALADGPRFIAELLSNLAFVGFANPGGFAEGVRMMRDIKTMREHSGVDILRNVGSVQTTRLFPKPDTISSRVVDSLRTSLGPDKSRVGGEVENKLKQIWAQTARRAQDARLTSQLADWMITTPDKMVTQPVWFGVFSNTFKEQTGQEVDFTKLAENDEAYMNQYEDAIKAATDAADDASVRTGATDNAFLGILRGTIRPDDSPVQSWFAMANSYMTRFLIFEYATARTAIQAAIGNGTISRGEGRRLIIATSARMVLYSFIVDILRRELDKALGLSDDDDEKEAGELMGDALLTGATSLMFGRTSGQIGRGLKGMLVENLNENYLHPDDYDYDERIMMPLIDLKAAERRPYKAINDVVTASLGPYGSLARTGVLAIKKVTEKDRVKGSAIDRQEAELNRLYLELAGVGGFIPLYKDLRRLYIKEIYKDLD